MRDLTRGHFADRITGGKLRAVPARASTTCPLSRHRAVISGQQQPGCQAGLPFSPFLVQAQGDTESVQFSRRQPYVVRGSVFGVVDTGVFNDSLYEFPNLGERQ